MSGSKNKRPKIIPAVEERIYRFIKNYGKTVYLTNIQLFSKIHKISPKQMGWALQYLKEKGRVYSGRSGWYVVESPEKYKKLREKWKNG